MKIKYLIFGLIIFCLAISAVSAAENISDTVTVSNDDSSNTLDATSDGINDCYYKKDGNYYYYKYYSYESHTTYVGKLTKTQHSKLIDSTKKGTDSDYDVKTGKYRKEPIYKKVKTVKKVKYYKTKYKTVKVTAWKFYKKSHKIVEDKNYYAKTWKYALKYKYTGTHKKKTSYGVKCYQTYKVPYKVKAYKKKTSYKWIKTGKYKKHPVYMCIANYDAACSGEWIGEITIADVYSSMGRL